MQRACREKWTNKNDGEGALLTSGCRKRSATKSEGRKKEKEPGGAITFRTRGLGKPEKNFKKRRRKAGGFN